MLIDCIFIVNKVYSMVINQKAIILSSSQSLNPLLNEVKKIKTETPIKERKYPWLPESHLWREEFLDLNPESSEALENQNFLLHQFCFEMCCFQLYFCQMTSIFLSLNSAQFRVDQQSRALKTNQPNLQRCALSGCWDSCMEFYAPLHLFNSPDAVKWNMLMETKDTTSFHSYLMIMKLKKRRWSKGPWDGGAGNELK